MPRGRIGFVTIVRSMRVVFLPILLYLIVIVGVPFVVFYSLRYGARSLWYLQRLFLYRRDAVKIDCPFLATCSRPRSRGPPLSA